MTARRIAIIPARGGSRRIPGKNIRDFCGRPMIAHILDTARESGLFDVVHVSTESAQVRETVERLGFGIDFMRPEHLADDTTPIMPVLKYVVETYAARGRQFDEVWELMACAPLIMPRDLTGAAAMFERTGRTAPLLAVAPHPAPIEWAYRRAADGTLIPVQPGMFAVRSQDLERAYFDAGSFAVMPTALVLSSEGAGSDTDYIGYVLDRTRAIDIDDEDDWALAESMFAFVRGTR